MSDTQQSLTSLIEKLEAAEGPNRELDARIQCHFEGFDYDRLCGSAEKIASDIDAPEFTASIDQALTLATDFGVEMQRRSNYDQDGILCTAYVWPILTDHRDIERDRLRGDGANLALAICAAALRAKLTETSNV